MPSGLIAERVMCAGCRFPEREKGPHKSIHLNSLSDIEAKECLSGLARKAL